MHLPTPRIDLTPERGALPAGGGTVRALLRVAVDFPPSERERDPLSLALVIDRSGSMSGAPLEHAKLAATAAVSALRDGDRVAVVAYDHQVDLVVPSTAVGDDRGPIARAIAAVRAGGTTALHAGWVEGCTQALTAPVASGLGRVVLLSDGLANVGVTDPALVAEDVARVTADGITTSTIGLGRHFDEGLMRHLADAGHGSYTFVESPDQLAGLFEAELAGLSALRGRRPTLALRGQGVRIVAALGGARLAEPAADASADAPALHLPDLIAGLPRELLLTLEVAPGARLDGVRLSWEDAFTRAAERLDVDLDVPTLPDADLARRPVLEAVASAARVADIAAEVARVERLARDERLDEAEVALVALNYAVAAWPADEARAAQLGDLGEMLEAVRERDATMAKKRTHRALYERERGVRSAEVHKMAAMERAWTQAHKAHAAPPPAESFTLLRADGSEVRIEVTVGDITEQPVDAIVNPSNRGLFGTAGVDGAVHRRGGPELTAACRDIGGIRYGQAVVTPGFRLPAGRVIHTTAHPWKGGGFGELTTLEAAYAASFEIAQRLRLRSLALPAIGTGAFGYPVDAATEIAVNVALRALMQPGELALVRFVLFEPPMAELYRRVWAQAAPQAASPRAAAS
jgi:Ca-activated chloride channel homolog